MRFLSLHPVIGYQKSKTENSIPENVPCGPACGVGAGGKKPPATRYVFLLSFFISFNGLTMLCAEVWNDEFSKYY